MKKLIILLLILFPLVAYAEVSGEIVKIDYEKAGKPISIWVQYKVDGKELLSKYSKIDGKSVFRLGIDYTEIAGMNVTETKTYIENKIGEQCENIISKEFRNKQHNAIVKNTDIQSLVGDVVSKTAAKVYIDIDKDGIIDEEWIVKTDGTKVVNSIK